MIGIRDFSKSGGKSGARPSKIVKINRNVLWNPRFWKVSAEWPQCGPRAKFSRPVYEFEFVTGTERPIFLISHLNIHSLLHRLFVFHKFQINILSQSKKVVCLLYVFFYVFCMFVEKARIKVCFMNVLLWLVPTQFNMIGSHSLRHSVQTSEPNFWLRLTHRSQI